MSCGWPRYGDFSGDVVFTDDSREQLVAAPGCWRYHGRSMGLAKLEPGVSPSEKLVEELGQPEADAKRAAYWVPIHLNVTNGSSREGVVRVRQVAADYPAKLDVAGGGARLAPGESRAVTVRFFGAGNTEANVVLAES